MLIRILQGMGLLVLAVLAQAGLLALAVVLVRLVIPEAQVLLASLAVRGRPARARETPDQTVPVNRAPEAIPDKGMAKAAAKERKNKT